MSSLAYPSRRFPRLCAVYDDCSGATPICDTTIDRCVECTDDSHCPDGTCNTASRMCEDGPIGCTEDSECPDGFICDVGAMECVPEPGAGCTSDDECGGSTPVCDTDAMECVECLENGDCATGFCDTGTNMCIDPTEGGFAGGALCATRAPGGETPAPSFLVLAGLAIAWRRRR